MKKTLLSLLLALPIGAVWAQTETDPVLLHVNGKAVTRAEFEYAFNKNSTVEGAVEKKTKEEYLQMFIDYKLKVAEAERLKLDTLSSFRKEFRQYRDLQLTPMMVDTLYIDSIARAIYDRNVTALGGKDLLRTSHILLMVKANDTEAARSAAQAKADSIYNLLQAGADFAETAQKFSQDPGSASRGGVLPWIGPGSVLKEYEDAAYALQTGEWSRPVLSSVGYHIIKMDERKQLEPYSELRPQIIAALKRQGIEEASAEARIKKQVDNSHGRLTREDVMDSLLNEGIRQQPELAYLVKEYYDGLLLFEVSKREVWDPAEKDTAGLEAQFKKNKKQYAWTEPRFKGYVIHLKDPRQLKTVRALLKKYTGTELRKKLKESVNKDSTMAMVTGPYLCKKGENAYVDHLQFGAPQSKKNEKFPYSFAEGKLLKQPKSYLDVKADVKNDLQAEREKTWVEGLRKRFDFDYDEQVLQTVNNH